MIEVREFAYTREDFERVRRHIHERAGIALADGKSEMVYSRLAKRVRALGIGTFDAYLVLLDDASHPEWEHFVNALTTNQTDFFREAHHFPILAQHARSLRKQGKRRPGSRARTKRWNPCRLTWRG